MEEEDNKQDDLIKVTRHLVKTINDKITGEEPMRAVIQVHVFARATQKDPNPVLAPGEFQNESTLAELATWIELFRTYLADGYNQSPAKDIAYIQKFMDHD